MKKRIVIGCFLTIAIAFRLSAQGLESDDMYFNSKDRERLKSAEADGSFSSTQSPKKKKELEEQVVEPVESTNTMDSYSARTINPEYIARSNSSQASEAEQNYYVEGYRSNTYDSYSATNTNSNSNNNNYNNNNNPNYANPMYNSGYGYNPYGYGNPYAMNPYSAGSGWTLSLGYYSGYSSGWNYGMSYGYGGSSYYNPYSCYSPYSSYGYGGYPTSYNGSYDSYSTTNYGKRTSRHSAIVRPTQQPSQSVSTTTNTSGRRSRNTTEEYYVKPSKRASTWSTSPFHSTQQNNSSYSGTRDRTSTPSYSSPSRNSNSYSSPSRSYSSPSRSGGGSTSPSRSRGRN